MKVVKVAKPSSVNSSLGLAHTTRMTDSQQADATLKTITNDNKAKKGLSTLLWRTLADKNRASPSCEDIKKFLDEQFNKDSYEETW